ncbi:MAG: UvrD-helicase domain-containing protein [Acidobacteria bacterium]|nr:UvrD-helicase domain-containing protein [Acidobacteriota bacterium]
MTGPGKESPDSAQRRRALDPARSFIVQSPAGSGKTELLIQRYLALLGLVDRPEAVSAITFTRKAAGEMGRRVMDALAAAAGERPDQGHRALTWDLARQVRAHSEARGWRLEQNPGRLGIQTIDALCASIVRRLPWLSRMGGTPSVVEDAGELYREAARATLDLLEGGRCGEEVAILLGHVDNDRQALERLLTGMLARRDQWLRHIDATDPEKSRAALERSLEHVTADAVAAVHRAVPGRWAAEMAAIAAEAGLHLEEAGREGGARACVGLAGIPGADRLDAWLGMADMLLTKGGTWRKSLTVVNGFPSTDKPLKERCGGLIETLSAGEGARAALDELRHLPDRRFSEGQWRILSSVVKLLPFAVARLGGIFRARGEADFVEVAIAARRSLASSPGAADGPDLRVEHILIDEFQDTSVSQHALLAALTAGWRPGDGRTVFAVGDPMQSIYRFREAEVGLFLKTRRDGIGAVPMEPITLEANFRSVAGVVEWVNGTFPGVMPQEEEIPTGAIPFSPSTAVRGEGDAPAVTLHPFIGRDDEGEAARVVEIVRSARDRGKKAAILVRSRSHLASIVPALEAAGLGFRAVEIEPLAGVSVIGDLTALTRAMLHPADRIAWLALLRAPWCGMTLGELCALAGNDLKAAIRDLARDEGVTAALGAEGRSRLARVAAVLESAPGGRSASLRARVEGAWLALGGPACAPGPEEVENAGVFFDLLEEMDDGGTLDLERFERRIGDLYARPDSGADDLLEILTIHKAKGLEFDVVVVPGLGRPPNQDEARLMLWLERPRFADAEADLLLASLGATGAERDRTYEYLRRIEGLKSAHETGRLLYVAATRARSELHLLGHAGSKAGEEGIELKEPASGSLLGCLWAAARETFEEAAARRGPADVDGGTRPPAERVPRPIRRLAPGWALPVLPAGVEGAAPGPGETGEGRVSFHWVGDTLRHVGTVVHQALRQMAEEGGWTEDTVRRRAPSFRSALASLGVPREECAAAAERVAAALVRAIGEERGRWLLGPHDRAACEYALSGVVEGRVVGARIDRTFVDERGTRWVVDYKSSLHEGAGVDAFLDNECARYREQLERYRALFGMLEERPIRTALYFPLLGAWREVD